MNWKKYGPALVTFFYVAISVAASYLPYPILGDSSVFGNFDFPRPRVGFYGLFPLTMGFFLTEVLALTIPFLKQWRQSGVTGRKALNRVAWTLSLFFALLLPTLSALTSSFQVEGYSFFQLFYSTAAPLIAVTLLRLALVEGINRLGIGMGLACLILAEILTGAVKRLLLLPAEWSLFFQRMVTAEDRFQHLITLALILGGVAFLLRYLFKSQYFSAKMNGREIKLESFTLPQTILGFSLGWSGVDLYTTARGFCPWLPNLGAVPWLPSLAALGIAGLISLGFFVLLAPASRLQRHLEGRAEISPNQIDNQNLRRFFISTLILGVISFALSNLFFKIDLSIFYWEASGLVILIAILRDLRNVATFYSNNGRGEKLIEFDNLEMAALAKAMLTEQGVPFYCAGYHYRRLFQIFEPAAKVGVYVRAGDVTRARELLATDSVRMV